MVVMMMHQRPLHHIRAAGWMHTCDISLSLSQYPTLIHARRKISSTSLIATLMHVSCLVPVAML